ncbi:MAG: hypothetical protein EXX96DRAFT_621105 [Benjaminiella poitrasii]|nr:MAG: hypothetical protein EXX96DRAFT_621105 [Benjaminiella poitrasii]
MSTPTWNLDGSCTRISEGSTQTLFTVFSINLNSTMSTCLPTERLICCQGTYLGDPPFVEHNNTLSSQNHLRGSITGSSSDASLVIPALLSSFATTHYQTTDIPHLSTHTTDAPPTPSIIYDKRIESSPSGSSQRSKKFLSFSLIDDTAINKSYKAAQLELFHWSLTQNVNINNFEDTDLVNFLTNIRITRHLQINTLKLWRSAITRFHRSPSSLADSSVHQTYFLTLAAQALPRRIHRPTFDLTPTLKHLVRISSDSSTPLIVLQSKLAILLGLLAKFTTIRLATNFSVFSNSYN